MLKKLAFDVELAKIMGGNYCVRKMDFQKLKATAVVRKNSLDFVERVFSLYNLRQPLVIVSDEAQVSTLPGIEIDRCILPAERSGWFSQKHAIIDEDRPAQVAFTSGTEGKPKGILLTYGNLADATRRIIDQMRMTQDIREYVGVPATYSFGLARYRAISAVGGQAYLSPRGFDPLELSKMLETGEVNALSAVPTLLRILISAPDILGDAGKNLRWMEIGSQQMSADEKRAVQQLFPNALIVQHYGLTEASRSTFLDFSSSSDLDSVGRPVGRTEIKVAADGRIRIRGPHVAKASIDDTGLHPLVDDNGWLQTNDLGHFDGETLFFDGRADDVINCGGIKISPDQLESRIRSHLGSDAQIAVAKVPDPQRGEGILVAVQDGAEDPKRVRELAEGALRDLGVSAGSALHVLVVDELPVTQTGKVQRKLLSQKFAEQSAARPAEKEASAAPPSDVQALFQREFPGQPVRAEDSFESLGGDSLHYIQFSLAFEREFGPLPQKWEAMSATALQREVVGMRPSVWRRLESVTLTRAFFIICIVALHTNAFIYSPNWGAAYFLILLAGYSLARFQLPEIIRSGSVRTLLGTIKYVAIPTLLVVAFLQVMTHRFEITPLLLVSNFLDPYTLKGFTFYFAEFYIQLLACAALLFSFGRVRDAFRTNPMLSAVVLFCVVVAIDRAIEARWNGDYNFHRTPWHYAWVFTLGMIMAVANDTKSRLFALAIAFIAADVVWGLTSAAFYVGGGCLIVLFIPALTVPAPVKVLIGEIAGASMFIYLSHSEIIAIVRKVFGTDLPWLSLFLSVAIGVSLTHFYAWCERTLSRMRRSAA
jgi:acyl-CoA synthetase (AMP-forming)/AMP-acid ligase II